MTFLQQVQVFNDFSKPFDHISNKEIALINICKRYKIMA